LGVVIRDCYGNVLASLCQNLGICYAPDVAEALAILRGLRLALEIGLVSASLDSDALAVVNLIANKSTPCSEIGVVIHDNYLFFIFLFYFLLRPCFNSINFVPRVSNKVVHSLAKLALGYVGEFVWLEDCPLSVESLVLDDCPIRM
jgi:hypothetical protein